RDRLIYELRRIREEEGLDILSLTDAAGRVLVRARNPAVYGDKPADGIIEKVLADRESVVATQIVAAGELEKEGEELTRQVRIKPIPTPRARIESTAELTSGMMIKAAAPVMDEQGGTIGLLYGGVLLNRSYEIVDEVKDVVYRRAQHRGTDIGTTTIFQGDVRIATNVLNSDGERAIGTRVSEEVYDQVLVKGMPWIGRAFVVNAWYITAYEPIRDMEDAIIGILYVGMLEAPCVELKNRVIFIMIAVALLTVGLLWVIGQAAARRIIRPVTELVHATNRLTEGDLGYRVDIRSNDEIGVLGESFNKMAAEQQRCTERFVELTNSLEKRIKQKTEELEAAQDHLIRTEKLGSMGKLAAGIAHEINNPLTSIMINIHLIAKRFGEEDRFKKHLDLIIDEIARCSTIVNGLLDFSRQSEAEKVSTNVNMLIEKTL
ncbi:MAG: cache domain-containing protein, partial [Candidatus Krumholzibacteria bacterium]|nr:cache domain-containing protein [Candidatus Krumholzibacteria bacterium]